MSPINNGNRRSAQGGRFFLAVFIFLFSLSFPAIAQKATSIVIHDSTASGAGGESATATLRSEIKAALEREKPCVEPFDDQDLRDAIQDERERALLEGGDSNEVLKQIGNRMNSGVVISVKGTPGPGGSMTYTASGLDTRSSTMVARESGGPGSERQMAENLVKSLGPYLADQCKPHWVGIVKYEYRWDETKEKTDSGQMRAASRNMKRRLTETSNWSNLIKATLQPPADGQSIGSPNARVIHRTSLIYTKVSSTTGELYCRLPGRNPFWKGYNEEYSETTTQIGQGTDSMPVFIEIDDDGSYTIRVNAPPGTMIGRFETKRSASSCEDTEAAPKNEVVSMPESRIAGTSFEANGKSSSPKPTTLSGSRSLPDGRTTITWNLRLVKPKGK